MGKEMDGNNKNQREDDDQSLNQSGNQQMILNQKNAAQEVKKIPRGDQIIISTDEIQQAAIMIP